MILSDNSGKYSVVATIALMTNVVALGHLPRTPWRRMADSNV